MTAATQVRERMYADNAKKKVKMAELQAFVSRFSANASKAKQATGSLRKFSSKISNRRAVSARTFVLNRRSRCVVSRSKRRA
jgi:ATPase subunit of ABC transporter with duplicated ATPase domains